MSNVRERVEVEEMKKNSALLFPHGNMCEKKP